MNHDACDTLKAAQRILDATYSQVLKEYAQDKKFTTKLKKSQRIWKKYVDSEMDAIYPEEEPNYYGTVQPMCLCNLMLPFVTQRTKELQQWLDGLEEGNVCSGSITSIPSPR